MNRKELLEDIGSILKIKADAAHITKTAAGHVLDALAEVAAGELLGGGEVPLPGLGKLKAKERKACMRRNPRNGATVQVPAKMVVKFMASKEMREALKS